MTARIAVPLERIEDRILLIRGHKVLLDADLAALYGVPTRRLNEQVKRNRARFPEDFVFRLSASETRALDRSQFATGSQKHRDPRFAPYAFTEHGTISYPEFGTRVVNASPGERVMMPVGESVS